MKKLMLLSGVALVLSACGGSQDIPMEDHPKIALPGSGAMYKVDKKFEPMGQMHGIQPTDTQLPKSQRAGFVRMNHAIYGLSTQPSGKVDAVFYPMSAENNNPTNAGTVYYKGHLFTAEKSLNRVSNETVKPYDVSVGELNMTVDFTRRTFEGRASNIDVRAADLLVKVKEGQPSGITEKMALEKTAERSYVFNGMLNGRGYEGTATMESIPYITLVNESANNAEVSGVDTSRPTIRLSNGQVKGQFYGANAEETVGSINFVGNEQYNAAFGAQRTN